MDEFETLAMDISKRAGAVPCDLEMYIEGLHVIIETLESDLTAAQEELNSRAGNG